MIGISKIDQKPYYDWDYVEKFTWDIKFEHVSQTSIEHYLIVFNEFDSDSKSND